MYPPGTRKTTQKAPVDVELKKLQSFVSEFDGYEKKIKDMKRDHGSDLSDKKVASVEMWDFKNFRCVSLVLLASGIAHAAVFGLGVSFLRWLEVSDLIVVLSCHTCLGCYVGSVCRGFSCSMPAVVLLSSTRRVGICSYGQSLFSF